MPQLLSHLLHFPVFSNLLQLVASHKTMEVPKGAVCPKCGYRDPPYWRPAKMHNPSGDIDIARIDDLQLFQKRIAEQLLQNRGKVVCDEHYAYYLGKRGVWVRRISLEVYRSCGRAAFKPPCETSGHNKLAIQIPKKREV